MFGQRPQVNKTAQTPESLDIYKASKEYKMKQGLRQMTPRKKFLLWVLPILVVVAGAIVYFILAASGDPGLKLVWKGTDTTIEGNTFNCGETDKAMDIRVANLGTENIVSVAAFIKYDPTKIEVTRISSAGTDFVQGEAGDTTPGSSATMQKIDNTNGLVQVVRGKPVDSSGNAFTGTSGLLATIYFNVKPGVTLLTSGPIFTFLTTDPNKSLVVLKGGQAVEPQYENGGVYNGTIRCCISPNDLCDDYEYCPNDNWQINPPPADYRCCQEACQQGIELYLFEREKTVETGQRFEISVNMRPDYQSISQMTIQLQLSPTDLASVVPEDIIFPGGIKGSATVNGGVITITISDFKTTKSVAVTLATITLTANDPKAPPFLNIDFDQSNTIITADNGSTIVPTFVGGKYKIVRKMIKLCEGTSVIVKPGNNSADFGLCVAPGSDCKLTTGGIAPSLYDGECNVNTESSHNLQMTGLTPGTEYNYEIVCDGTDLCGNGATRTKYATDAAGTNHVMYEPLTISGTFKTLSTQEFQIINEKAKDIRATSATIEWNTIGGPNGDGLSDSVVCSDGTGNRVVSSNLTSKHSMEIMGLTPGKTYTVTIGSLSADDVVAARAGSSGCACPVGACKTKTLSFTTKKQVETADANVILKVNKDRVCDEWLYCNAETQLRVSNATPAERVCFQVGKCNKLDESGNCIGIVDEEKTAATVESPKKVAEIRNVSGYGKVGIDWGSRCLNTGRVCAGDSDCGSGDYAKCASAKIDGLYPYSQMSQIGVPIVIKNYNFENGIILPWKENGNAYIENYNYDKANRVLKIWPKAAGFSGAYAKEIAGSIVNSPKAFYVVSFWAKSDDEQPRDVVVELTYGPDAEKPSNFIAFKSYNENIGKADDVVKISNVWREYIVSLSAANLPLGYKGPVGLMIVQNPTSKSTKPFYIDNVSMKSVLELGDNMNYAARSCRLYPNETAPACDYYDGQSGKNYRGWKGYCVETDPGYQERKYASQPMCLLWWPVDIINGESNIFYQDPSAVDYTGRKPLYYCLEGAGNYSRCGKEGIERTTYTGIASSKAIIDRCSDKYEVHNYYNKEILSFNSFGVSECNGDNNNKPEGLENGGYTFFVCKNDFSGNGGDFKIPIGEENIEYGIKEYELAYVFVDAVGDNGDYPGDFVISREKFGTVETSRGGGTMQFIREDNLTTGKTTWIASSNWDGKHNRLRLSLVFDKQKGLESYWINGADDTGEKHEGETYIIRFYLREPCLKIAQVVDYEGNTVPRMGRINSEKIADEAAVNIWPGYAKKQDYNPYGSSLVPEPSYDPTQWGLALGGPLYVEPPNTVGDLSAPYQVRAGTPLAINGNTRSGKKPGSLGFSGTVCISGKIGNSCPNGNVDCGLVGETDTYGECVGFNNTGNKDWAEINAIAKNKKGEEILQQLFVRSFGIWEWQFIDGVWKYAPSTTANWDPVTLGLGVKPRVSFMYAGAMGNEKDINIAKSGAVTLYFGSWVDEDQKPLVRYTVDWGDGSQSTEAGLTIPGRDVSNPHILVHYYKYDPNDATCSGGNPVGIGTDSAHCEYNIKVQIEDNWGLCNEVGDCTNSGAWKEYGGVIKVYEKEQVTELGALMEVSPLSLSYKSTGLPQTQTFTINNPGDKDLTWRIKSILSKNSNTASFLVNLMSAKYNLAKMNVKVGQSMVTPAGNKQDVNIEISGKPSVMANGSSYTDIITLEDMSNGICQSGEAAGASCAKDSQCGTGGVCELGTYPVEVTLTIDN